MQWRFWRRRKPRGCEHLWSDWSDPKMCIVTIQSTWGPTGEKYESEMQERRCLTCNLIDRRVLR